ncbi:phosphomannomutase [Sinimarinibacterium flocculans]|uniref:phosphomannomutase n=1 Tax=Sinimarinibacterium flocculans TaxID=985250 RepID=UPI002493B458|nr:phosphomannomutase [Sinimarinibacterium flocculans]
MSAVHSCFNAYDLRGRVPDDLNADVAYRLGLAFGQRYRPRNVALGRDIRHSSLALLHAVAHGLRDEGANVIDLGLCGTEESYWAAQQPGIDGAIQITASHNPIDYNGMKLVRAGALPISSDSGLRELEAMVLASSARVPHAAPVMTARSYRSTYIQHLLSYIDVAALRPLRVVVNAGNGGAGAIVDALAPHLPFELIRVQHEANGDFPNGIPNPLLPQNRTATRDAVCANEADFGVAWDGDFDRCFLFDEQGSFIEGYYIVGLLAAAMLRRYPGEKIIHDPRLTWNTIDIVNAAGGTAIQSRTGHAFIKERMRAENAVYGGEMSAHHYFRDFGYCDNGNIPWLLVAGLLSAEQCPLSQLLAARIERYPSSGEINCTVASIDRTLTRIESIYGHQCESIDRTDGIGLSFRNWRFNLRGSNTEPVIRLNVESRGDRALMLECTAELLAHIRG